MLLQNRYTPRHFSKKSLLDTLYRMSQRVFPPPLSSLLLELEQKFKYKTDIVYYKYFVSVFKMTIENQVDEILLYPHFFI